MPPKSSAGLCPPCRASATADSATTPVQEKPLDLPPLDSESANGAGTPAVVIGENSTSRDVDDGDVGADMTDSEGDDEGDSPAGDVGTPTVWGTKNPAQPAVKRGKGRSAGA